MGGFNPTEQQWTRRYTPEEQQSISEFLNRPDFQSVRSQDTDLTTDQMDQIVSG